ncbi:ABC transporter permease [Pedobacter sp. JY14-1]|uniref:ABC transporter permease n=1 Tax=Pedobacter sp. JY14-1 TaxID=3034151 RepID=UPI0023E28628|nr:ABC transporter permease [Pedobacter sp. JY14-1]
MYKLNFKIALRSIWKHKSASLINMLGLAIGLAACILLMLYVGHELSFDRRGHNAGQVYQVMTNFEDEKGKIGSTSELTSNMAAPTIRQEIPEVIASSRIGYGGLGLVSAGREGFRREVKFAEPDIVRMYPYHFLEGDSATALSSPQSVILTRSTASLLFGRGPWIGKTLRYQDESDLQVSGVVEDLPLNSSNRFDVLIPWSFYESKFEWVKVPEWGNYNWQTLVLLDKKADVVAINKKLHGLIKRHQKGSNTEMFLYPLSEKHLHGSFLNGKSVGGEISSVYLFTALAIGILLIACINFMNLATAKSEKRAREVGIKKTLGAQRSTLISQFFMESTVLTVISAAISIVLVEVSLPAFNHMLHMELHIDYRNPVYWLGMLACILVTGLISGSYPALYLSSFDPVRIFRKRTPRSGMFNVSFRQVLVVLQFTFTIVLIISTAMIYRQVGYIRDRPVGYDIDQLVEIPQEGTLTGKFALYREALLRSGAVTNLCQSSGSISRDGSSFWYFEWPGMDEADKMVVFNQIVTTYDYAATNGLKMLAGRDFSREFASDTAGVLLSSKAVKVMKLKDPVGTRVKYHGEERTVVGVFQDFIWGSPFYSEKPMVIAFNPGWSSQITLRLNPANSLSSNIETITRITKEINPAYPPDLKFVSSLYAEKLQKERILGILANLFGGLAIFVSCLGLFALAAYSAEQRTKEFGVRKVLGASVSSIMGLLSVSFMKTIFIAVLAGVPLAGILISRWLNGFDYQVSLSWWVITLSVGFTLMVAFLTVSMQAYKAARTNPVDALKYE